MSVQKLRMLVARHRRQDPILGETHRFKPNVERRHRLSHLGIFDRRPTTDEGDPGKRQKVLEIQVSSTDASRETRGNAFVHESRYRDTPTLTHLAQSILIGNAHVCMKWDPPTICLIGLISTPGQFKIDDEIGEALVLRHGRPVRVGMVANFE